MALFFQAVVVTALKAFNAALRAVCVFNFKPIFHCKILIAVNISFGPMLAVDCEREN